MQWSAFFIMILFLAGCGKQEETAETWSIVAEIVEASDFPTLREIRPYRDALIAHQYRIVGRRKETGAPNLIPGEVAIYHWAIIDEKPTEAAELKVGDMRILDIQRMIDRTDLKGRYRKNSLDAFDLQEFFAVESKPGVLTED